MQWIGNIAARLAMVCTIAVTGPLCACTVLPDRNASVAESAASTPAAHACCQSDPIRSAPAQDPSDGKSCPNCDRMRAACMMATPKAVVDPVALQSAIPCAVPAIPTLIAPSINSLAHRVADDIPIPPLLQDLFHTSCLLTT
jgi:hypothetical protein